MKKIALTAVLACFFVPLAAQEKFTGNWEGKLNVGAELRVVFHITSSDGSLDATMDSPDQGVKDIKCSRVIGYDDSLIIEMAAVGGIYRGKLTGTEEVNGRLEQKGMTFPLTLKKTDKPSVLNRPQTPEPPFDYMIEDISYYNADTSITYGATLSIPKGKGPFPAVLLLTGSGQQNRDEELFGHKPFAVVADYLTRAGYIVLRADDRGMGQTTGLAENLTTADFVKDALCGVQYLKSRPETDVNKIGLYGHSEGGMIAEIVAAQNKDIYFMILMAAPGVSNMLLLEEQNVALLEKAGISKEMAEAYRKLYREVTRAAIKSKDSARLRNEIAKVVEDWKKKTPPATVQATTGITGVESQEKVVQSFVNGFDNAWTRYFLSYDPKPYLQKTTAKILALNGEKDIQVVSAANLEGIRKALAKGKTKTYEVKELPGLNHLFQACKACNINEYAQLEETISPTALKVVKDWMDKEVK